MNHGPEVYSLKISINLVRVLDKMKLCSFAAVIYYYPTVRSPPHLAHLPRVHEEEVPDLVDVEPDHVDAALDLLHLHAEQRLRVLVVPADALPVIRVNVVIIIVILRILHLHLEPDL